jgi:hypothetical protein
MIDQRYRDLAGAAEEAARPPAFASVRRRAGRLRARRRAGGALAAAVLMASGVAGFAALRPSAEPWEPATGFGQVLTADAADSKHLYAITTNCDTCARVLVASQDGGQTWQKRREWGAAAGTVGVRTLGPEVLLLTWSDSRTDWNSQNPVDPNGSPLPYTPPPTGAPTPTLVPGGIPEQAVSVDGGRTLRQLTVSHTPVAAAAPGTRLVGCFSVVRPQNCAVYAVDPESGQLAPLATQPPLAHRASPMSVPLDPIEVPTSAGLWVVGADPQTGRPAVAVSKDQGRTWQKSVFEDETGQPGPGQGLSMYPGPAVATSNGKEAYVVFVGPDVSRVAVYRSSDGGKSWERARGEFPRNGILTGSGGMVTADGTHVLPGASADGQRYLGSRDGDLYAPIELSGHPGGHAAPRAITSRFFIYEGEGELYVSTDGRSWHLVLG